MCLLTIFRIFLFCFLIIQRKTRKKILREIFFYVATLNFLKIEIQGKRKTGVWGRLRKKILEFPFFDSHTNTKLSKIFPFDDVTCEYN